MSRRIVARRRNSMRSFHKTCVTDRDIEPWWCGHRAVVSRHQTRLITDTHVQVWPVKVKHETRFTIHSSVYTVLEASDQVRSEKWIIKARCNFRNPCVDLVSICWTPMRNCGMKAILSASTQQHGLMIHWKVQIVITRRKTLDYAQHFFLQLMAWKVSYCHSFMASHVEPLGQILSLFLMKAASAVKYVSSTLHPRNGIAMVSRHINAYKLFDWKKGKCVCFCLWEWRTIRWIQSEII